MSDVEILVFFFLFDDVGAFTQREAHAPLFLTLTMALSLCHYVTLVTTHSTQTE